MSSQIANAERERIKQDIRVLVEKYNRVLEEKRISKYNEETTKAEFIEPLFEALGWDVRNIANKDEVSREEKISKNRVDYGFRINGIPKFFLEAKAIREDPDDPKFLEQALYYAFYKRCPWVVLTNFETVNILNAEWEVTNYAYSRFRKIKYNEFLEDFEDLWLLSRESFEQGSLDRLAEKRGLTKKTSIDKQLLNDFTKFRDILSKSVTRLNQVKKLTQAELDESIQRILDRLIFIRNCEDKGLEEKKLWEARNEIKVWNKVKEVFAYYDKNYDSKLFTYDPIDTKRVHLCDTLIIDDGVVKEIIECLYRTRDKSPYDFSIIDADVLGTVYEQYLGHILKKTEKRATLTENHVHRKEQGIYYTPIYIVDYIVRNTLEELLKGTKVNIEKIKVLDPACGSGSFLIKTFDVLYEYYKRTDKNYAQTQFDITGRFTIKEKIIQNNIFGVDLDEQAVEIAQLNLLLKIAEKKQRLPLLQGNIKCGNSLIDDEKIVGDKAFKWEQEFKQIMDDGGFDVVIGNPPYVRADVDDEEYQKQRKWMENSGQYETLYEKWDLFIAFIERGIKLLRNNGVFSFIVSNSFNTSKYADKLKKYLLDNYWIKQIDFFKDVEVFKGVGVESVILTIEKSQKKGNTKRILHTNSFENRIELEPSNDIRKMFRISTEIDFNNKFTNTELLGDICYMSVGMVLNANETIAKGEFTKDDLISDIKDQKHPMPYIEAENIHRYRIKSIRYLEWSTERVPSKIRRPTFSELYLPPKLIRGRTTDGIFDENHLVCNDGCILFVPFHELQGIHNRSIENSVKKYSDKSRKQLEENSKRFYLKYILAVLNSKFARFYLNTIRRHRIEYYFYPEDIRKLPIKNIPEYQQKLFIKFVDEIILLNKRLNELGDKRTDEWTRIEMEIKKADAEIDELIYQLYDITEEEKKIIEESLK